MKIKLEEGSVTKIELENDKVFINTLDDKKLKGYQYDSLVYRYIRAREQMAEYEYLRSLQGHDNKDWNVYRQRANRDIMRFVQILDEVMGEHE